MDRNWKGYPFEAVNELMQTSFMEVKKSKSVYLTESTVKEAGLLVEKSQIKNDASR